MKKTVILVVLVMLSMVGGVYAQHRYGIVQELQKVYQVNNPIVDENGDVQVYKDPQGGNYMTLNYRNRTYLPLRAIAEQNGYNSPLMWNGVTGEIHLEKYNPPDLDKMTAQICYIDATGFAFYNNETYYYCEVNFNPQLLDKMSKGDTLRVIEKNGLYYPNRFHYGTYPSGEWISGNTSILR